jgi:hypothetical protein
MHLSPETLSPRHVLLTVSVISALALVALLVKPEKTHAQQKAPPAAASVGVTNPLPVYMVNEPPGLLPDGFEPGTSWKFSTWTVPSSLTFTATVEKTQGGWAYLTVKTDTPAATRWYFIPQMPGAWEPQ